MAVSVPVSAAVSPEMGLFKKKKKKVEETPKDSTVNQYEKITKGAEVKNGLFTVYKKKSDYYFAIPDSLLGRDMLVINKLQRVPDELGEARANRGISYEEGLVRFELDTAENKLRIRQQTVSPLVDEGSALARSVQNNYLSPLIYSLKIEAYSKDSTTVLVKVNDLFNGASTNLNDLFKSINAGGSPNRDLSRILRIEAFPNNVIAYSEFSTKVSEPMSTIFLTVEVSTSIVLLPETPMRGREDDPRIGYFVVNRLHYSDTQQKVDRKSYLTRWRLEPKPEDEAAYLRGELVEPAKPIIFYIDPATPEQWKPWIKKGVEDWQVAFEQAGFKNAIRAIVLDDSTAAASDDVSTSVITYTASTTANAMGPSTYDPRTGEILDADVIWWHNTLTILKEWITVQTAAVNPAAREAILPDSLMGDAMRFVACHEVGHSLGLRHNMRASYGVPTDSLRSASFMAAFNATASSIMDYARYNYVAQPQDGVNPANMSPHIGPYDKYAIEYGYRWYGNLTPEEEEKALHEFVSNHTGNLYEYSGEQSMRDAVDPRGMSEDLGDDPVKSATCGIENLKRIVPNILSWSRTSDPDQTYDDASTLFFGIANQWNQLAYHVLANIGGIYIDNVVPADGRQAFTFTPAQRQKEAARYLIDQVLNYPAWLFDSEVSHYTFLNRNTPIGKIEEAPILTYKNALCYILWDMLTTERLTRMLENERINGKKNVFTALEYMDMLHEYVFRSTERGATPDIMERNLQKLFVDGLMIAADESQASKNKKSLVEESAAFLPENPALQLHSPLCSEVCAAAEERWGRPRTLNFYGSQVNRISDIISLKRGEMLRIYRLLQSKVRTGDRMAQNHYRDLIMRIESALGLN